MWYYIEIQIKSTPVEIPEPTPGATEIPITAVLDNTTTDGSIDGVDLSVNPCTGKCPSGMCQADPSVGKECSMKIYRVHRFDTGLDVKSFVASRDGFEFSL